MGSGDSIGGDSVGRGKINQVHTLLAGLCGNFEDGLEKWVDDDSVSHGFIEVVVGVLGARMMVVYDLVVGKNSGVGFSFPSVIFFRLSSLDYDDIFILSSRAA